MPRVVHFEIHADDPQRAADFYANVFDWKIDKWDGPEEYWLCSTGNPREPGINGGILKRRHPERAVYNTLDVASVDDYIVKITSHGGEIVIPKTPIAGVGWLAYFKDTEGNVFGIMQPDPSAK